jgi:hypothetical protein
MTARPFDRARTTTMKSLLRSLALSFAAALAIAAPASASTFSVDYTDLWYVPNESGWGLNLIQQNNVIFATMFVYGTDNTPRWYVASALQGSNGTNFTGSLFKTTGAYFGAAWNQGQSTTTPVGSMSIAFSSPTAATLTYTADGVTVTKSVQRQTWTGENLSGKWLGGIDANTTACTGQPNQEVLISGSMTVSHNTSNQAVTIALNATTSNTANTLCNFTGTYGQHGKLGSITGNWSCTVGGAPYNNGTFTLSDLQATVRGFSAGFQASDQFCQYSGNFGVVKQVNQ